MDSVDTTIVIPNEKLLAVAQDAGFFESFRVADDILRQGVQGISDIITIPGIINRDFADVKAIMARMGYAVMGTATANGSRRAIEAAQKAIASPLLEAGAIDGARGILINITGSASLKLAEVQEACSIIQNAADDDANIIFGAVLDEKMKDAVKITVIATGFRDEDRPRRRTESSGFTVNAGADDFDSMPESPRMVMESHDEPRLSSREQPSGSSFNVGAPLLPDVGRSGIQDGVAVDSMRDAMIANFEQADLDVPAFLRKRGETM
jgi:cell division protein FtsZ